MATPYATHILARTTSTQDEARRRFVAGREPVLVVAAHQSAGRGRQGRVWESADRGLFCSLALSARAGAVAVELTTLIACMELRDAIDRFLGVEADVKWPNDLLVGGAKCAGILAESDGEALVVGCGVNLWWRYPPAGAVGLCADDPGPQVGRNVATRWAGRFIDSMQQGRFDMDAYRRACLTLGREVTWDGGGSGRAVDVDAAGGLIVHTATGPTTLRSGEVGEVRPATLPADRPSGS